VTLDEKLTLEDTTLIIDGVIIVTLDEKLTLQDTSFNTDQTKQVTLDEKLTLQDATLTKQDIQLDETLDLQDTKFNTQPNAVNDNSITPEDITAIVNVLANDSDLDVDPIVISSFDTTSTNGGTVTIDDNGTPLDDTDDPLIYTPPTNFNGVDTFTYIISDDNGGFDTATVTVTVTDVNDLPVANDDSTATPQNTAVPINVLANDFDVDGTINPISVAITSGPLSGTVSVNSITGKVTYNPNTGFVGTVTFVYSVADDDGDIDSATVTVIVTSTPVSGGGPSGGGGGGGSGGGGATSTTGPGLPGIIGPAAAGKGGGSTKFHDVTVQIGTEGKIKAANAGGSCVDTHQTIKVSSIVESLSPLKRVELRFVHEGEPLEDYTAIRMQITNMTIGENLYSVSGSIPWELMSGSYGVRYWLHALNEDLEISDSTKYLISVRPGYSILGNLEFDVVTIKAEGSTLKPIAYFTNTISKPVSGAISLIVDGKVVDTSQPQSFEPGETSVPLVWKIPRVGTVVDYQVNVIAEFCGKIFETEEVTLSTFPRTVIESIPDKIHVKLFTDQLGNTIARAGSLYSSDVNPYTNFRVTSPDGTCVIGDTEECLIRESTFGSRGNVESVTIDGQVYRIRYSGSENVVERFTITSIDPILGYWNVYKETTEGIIPEAYAAEDNLLKIQYRAQELKVNTGHDINFQEIKPLEEQETIEFGGKITSEADQPIKFFDITVELINPSAELTTILVHLSPTKTVRASEAFKESLDGKPLTVSAVVQKPIDFNRAELRFVNSYQSYDEYSAIKMDIDNLLGNPTLSIISASIPWALISKGPIAVYWIQLQGDVIRESDKFTINVGNESSFDYEENQNPTLVPQTLGTFVKLTSINPNTIDKADNKTPSIDIKGELDNWTDLEGYPIVDIFAPNGKKIWNDIVLNNVNQKNSDVWEFTRNNFRVGSLSELPTGEYLIEMSSSNDIRKDSLDIPLKSQMSFVIDDSNSGMGGILHNDVPPSIDVSIDSDRNTIFGIIILAIIILILSVVAIAVKSRYQKTLEI
ncbi:MAG: cadherin-like domain-containing protein, partial [Nitrosopumilaceae archaeon]